MLSELFVSWHHFEQRVRVSEAFWAKGSRFVILSTWCKFWQHFSEQIQFCAVLRNGSEFSCCFEPRVRVLAPCGAKISSFNGILSKGFEFWRHFAKDSSCDGILSTGFEIWLHFVQRVQVLIPFCAKGLSFNIILSAGFEFGYHFWAQGSSFGCHFEQRVQQT